MAAAQECTCAGVEDGPLRDVPAVAAHLAVSERFVRTLIATGAIAVHRLGPKALRICRPVLQAYLNDCLKPAAGPATAAPPAPAPRLRSVPTSRTRSPSRIGPSETPWNRRVA